jgi:hypothetical protein
MKFKFRFNGRWPQLLTRLDCTPIGDLALSAAEKDEQTGLGEYFPMFESRANVHQRHLFIIVSGAETHHGPSPSDIPAGSIVARGTSARNSASQAVTHHVL